MSLRTKWHSSQRVGKRIPPETKSYCGKLDTLSASSTTTSQDGGCFMSTTLLIFVLCLYCLRMCVHVCGLQVVYMKRFTSVLAAN